MWFELKFSVKALVNSCLLFSLSYSYLFFSVPAQNLEYLVIKKSISCLELQSWKAKNLFHFRSVKMQENTNCTRNLGNQILWYYSNLPMISSICCLHLTKNLSTSLLLLHNSLQLWFPYYYCILHIHLNFIFRKFSELSSSNWSH